MEHCLLIDDKIRCHFFLDTLDFLSDPQNQKMIQESANSNFHRMRGEAKNENQSSTVCQVEVYNQDWGSVTALLTKKYGEIFTVINIADPVTPGSAASNGKDNLEASIFRRSNIALTINPEQLKFNEINRLICFKKPETKMVIQDESKYTCDFLFPSEFFPFQELRGEQFNTSADPAFAFDFPSIREGIIAQLETLKKNNIKHVVLTSFNCGKHAQARELAQIYKEEIEKRQNDFVYIGFAILKADNPEMDHHSAFCEKFAAAQNDELTQSRESVESAGSEENRGSLLINIMSATIGSIVYLMVSVFDFILFLGNSLIAAGTMILDLFSCCCPPPESSEASPTQGIYSSFGHRGNTIDVSSALPAQSTSFGALPVNLSGASFALNAVASGHNGGMSEGINAENTSRLEK